MRKQLGVSKLPSKFLFFFGLIFFLAGMAVGVFAVMQLYGWIASGNWDQVPMTIVSTDLEVHYDDGSTTYQTVAQYRYTYNGQQYENDRVSFSAGSDNIGSFHEDTYALLRRHLNGEPFIGYVNPEHPEKSVLIRKMRWGMFAFTLLFPVLFGGVGFGIMAFSYFGGKTQQKQQKIIQDKPERQWQAAKQWHSNRLECSNKGLMWFALIFAIIWNLISLPILFIVPGEVLDKGNYPALLGLLFPVIGVGLIIWAVRSVRKWRKFGRSAFVMNPFPAHPGGIVRGTLELQSPLDTQELQARLSCIRKVTTGSGKNRSTRETFLWQDEQVVPIFPQQKHHEFGFRLNQDARLSDDSNSSDQLLWRIDCSADVPGVDFSANFEVPVIAGQPDEQTILAAEQLTQQQTRQARLTDAWKETGVQAGNQGGYPSYLFAAGRNKGVAASLGIFGLIFTAVGVGIGYFGGAWIFGGIFALFGLLMLWGMLYYLLHSTEFIVRPDRLEVTSGMLFKKRHAYPVFSIQSIDLKSGSRVGSKQYWSIILKTSSGQTGGYGGYKPDKARNVTLASDIPSRRAAQALIDKIKRECGLDK